MDAAEDLGRADALGDTGEAMINQAKHTWKGSEKREQGGGEE